MNVQFYGYKFGGIAVFYFSVVLVYIVHSFQKLVSDFNTFLQLKHVHVQLKNCH